MRFGITLNVGTGKEPYDSINHSYVTFLENLNITPVLIPNSLSDPYDYVKAMGGDGVILSGGNDISGNLYQQNSINPMNVSELRDSVEARILEMAIQEGMPVFGICRGMQFINVFFGGSLIQDLQSHTGGVPNHVGQPHKVIIRDLFGLEMKPSEFEVNSYHNQGVTTAVLSDQLKVFAISPGDGIIEGIIHPTHKVLGVQWHPERPGSSSDLDQRMLEHILRGSFWII